MAEVVLGIVLWLTYLLVRKNNEPRYYVRHSIVVLAYFIQMPNPLERHFNEVNLFPMSGTITGRGCSVAGKHCTILPNSGSC